MKFKMFNGQYRQGKELSFWLQLRDSNIGFRIGNWMRFEIVKVSNYSKRFYFSVFCIEYNNYKVV